MLLSARWTCEGCDRRERCSKAGSMSIESENVFDVLAEGLTDFKPSEFES